MKGRKIATAASAATSSSGEKKRKKAKLLRKLIFKTKVFNKILNALCYLINFNSNFVLKLN